MNNGWGSYSLFLVAGVLSLSLPVLLSGISKLLGRPAEKTLPTKAQKKTDSVTEIFQDRKTKLNARFFHAFNTGIMLVLMVLILIPGIAVFKGLVSSGDRVAVNRALFSLLMTLTLIASALFYVAKKGDLDWLRSFKKDSRDE